MVMPRLCPLVGAGVHTATGAPAPRKKTMRGDPMDRPVRTLIIIRSAFNLIFAVYLLLLPMIAQRPSASGYYALGDGAIAIALAIVLFRDPRGRWLFLLVLFDGLVRLALGAFLFANPGVLGSSLGSAIMVTIVIFVMSAMGLAGMVVGLVGRPVATDGAAVRRARAWPVFFAGLCTLLFGVALIVGPPGADNSRLIVCAYAFAFGLALLSAGIRPPRL